MKKFAILLILVAFLTVSCVTKTPILKDERIDGNPKDILGEMVAQTLEAFTQQPTATTQPDQIHSQNGEKYSIEVTQPVGLLVTKEPVSDGIWPHNEDLPVSHYIWNILGHRQYFSIGCEASTADDWAKYFGVEINEFAFQVRLPISDNPDLGFVGDVNGPWGQVPPYAYGVHAEPVAKVLRDYYGMNAVGVKGFTIEALKAEIAADRPVITWVVANCTWSDPYEYTDKAGNKVITAPYEHVVIVTGYNETSIRYMNNGKFFDIPTEYFERTWSVLGNMAVFLEE